MRALPAAIPRPARPVLFTLSGLSALLLSSACYSPPARLLHFADPESVYARASGVELRLQVLDEREVFDRALWLSAPRRRSGVSAFGPARTLPALTWLRIQVFNYGRAPVSIRPADFRVMLNSSSRENRRQADAPVAPISYERFAGRFGGDALGALSPAELSLAPQPARVFALLLPTWRQQVLRGDRGSTAAPAEAAARTRTLREIQRDAFPRGYQLAPGSDLELILVFEGLRHAAPAGASDESAGGYALTDVIARLPELRFRLLRTRVARGEDPPPEYARYEERISKRRAQRLERNARLRRQYYAMHAQLREHDRPD